MEPAKQDPTAQSRLAVSIDAVKVIFIFDYKGRKGHKGIESKPLCPLRPLWSKT
jgi:hypothetical protein